MIPSFKPGILSSNRIRAVASADVTPNAVNWNDVAAPGGSTNTVTITGINTAINLSISWTGYPGFGGFDVYKNDSQISLAEVSQNEGSPYTLSVSNNDEIYFSAFSPATVASISVTVTNASDGDTVLDTFTLNVGDEGGGG
jgi:hypothetical protein